MTNPDYILEFMRENDMRYFIIANSFDRETTRQFNDMGLDEAVRKMKRFFDNNSGFHRIKLYQSNEILRGGKPKQEPAMFEINISPESYGKKNNPGEGQNSPIGNLSNYTHPAPSPSGAIVGVDQYLNIHSINADLKAENEKLKMQLEYMQNNYEKELENLRREMEVKIKEAQDSNQIFSQGLGLLMERMGVGG
jgi:hypothetical protein